MSATTLTYANAMPAPTWYRLKDMSDTNIELAELPQADAGTQTFETDAAGAAGDFDAAMDAAQAEWLAAHPEPFLTTAMVDEGKDPDAVYGGTALSKYQRESDEIESAKDLRVSFETGVGAEAFEYMRARAAATWNVTSAAGSTAAANLHLDAVDGAVNIAAVDVVAGANSELTVIVSVDSPKGGQGIVGTSMRVFADKGARVHIIRTQTSDATFTDLDDMGLFTADGAFIDVRQTVLGAAKAYTGLAGDIRGNASRIDIDARYLGTGDRSLDFNYELRHHGQKTESHINGNGVLAGESKKSMRQTIDLVRGCKGAVGAETETVLLADEDVRNNTVPAILCNEDDVMGNHGATIGHVRPEQLFYLSSRGLSQRDAENMFVRAMLEQAAIDAPDDVSRAGVMRLGSNLLDNFTDFMDEE